MAEQDQEIGQLDDGGTIQTTDLIPVERGDGNVYASIGSAGTKAASNPNADQLSSVAGTVTAGHMAVFTDTAGSIGDGGPIPLGIEALMGSPILGSVSVDDYIAVIHGGTLYRALVSSVLAATGGGNILGTGDGNTIGTGDGNEIGVF